MNISLCFWTATLNSGPWHLLHWPLLWVALFLLGLAVALGIRTTLRRQRRLKSRQEWISSIDGLIPNRNSVEKRTMTSETTFKTHAERWIISAGHWAKNVLRIGTKDSGRVRPLTPLLLICLTFPSVIAGFTAGFYAREAQLAQTRDTYTWLKVLKVYDSWDFKVQFIAGGEPFDMHFLHDGSDLKLGWDEGMIIEYVTFEMRPKGLTVAQKNLGMQVHRNVATSKFIDWREQ
jgi:hypothetical protein